MNNDTTERTCDAEATVKFAIMDGIASSFGQSPEKTRDTIYKSILSADIRWALLECLQMEVQ